MRQLTARASLIFVLLALCGATSRAAADVVRERAALYAAYATKLDALAAECGQQGRADAVEQLQKWLPKRDSDTLTLFVLPFSATGGPSDESRDAPWRKRWQPLRDEQAEALFALARQAADDHRPSLAYELVIEAVRENPDHKSGRRMLGYVRYRDEWHTPFEIRQLSGGKVWHDKFGWLPKAHVERYAPGERYYQGRWMTAAEEAKLRSDMKRGWRVESEHYVVTTNHSLEEGVWLAQRLEKLHAIWQQVFIGYTTSDAELARRFLGRPAKSDSKQHNVVYFRTRDEYKEALRPAQPKIDITLGIYLDKTRVAYFFAGQEQEPGTLYHEATHQLFQETRQVVSNVGRTDNFWIIEGIACYMESLADRGDYFTLGGADAGRMRAARHRLLTDKLYLPLAELVEIGMESLQSDSRMPWLYSQSAGLADFFMHAERGRYREPLVRYLVAIYTGRANTRTLAELTGADYQALDRQYAAFMSQVAPATAESPEDATPARAAR